MDSAAIRTVRAGDRDWLVARHAALYARDEGFDDTFGPLVARIVDGFLAGHDPRCEAGWIAEGPAGRLGSVFCVREDAQTAKLRLFLLEPAARGRGLGRRMLDTCTGFARASGYAGMRLWTHAEHRAACELYARNGWKLDGSRPVRSFGRDLTEQTWRLDF